MRPDGAVMRDHFVFQMKSPAESREPWDYYKLMRKVDGDAVLPPLDRSACALVRMS